MLSEEEIKLIAAKIEKLKLATPCAFLLEAHLPISGMLHNVAIAGQPFFNQIKGYENISAFFSERTNIEMLITELNKQ